jgi:chromosome segregation ATPase
MSKQHHRPAAPSPAQQIAEAEKIINELERKRSACVAKVAELTERRKQIAYSAHAAFDAEASREIGDVRADLIAAEHQVVELDAALVTARQRLQQAEAERAREADKAEARELRKALTEFVDAGRRVDHALELLARDGHALTDALRKIHTPSSAQMDSLGMLCLRTAIMQTPWARSVETVPPNQRRSFRSLIEGWAANIENNNIKPRLNESEAA